MEARQLPCRPCSGGHTLCPRIVHHQLARLAEALVEGDTMPSALLGRGHPGQDRRSRRGGNSPEEPHPIKRHHA